MGKPLRLSSILAVALAGAALAAAGAEAQRAKGQGVRLSPAEVKAGLFGIDMVGYSPSGGYSWRECIDPLGKTLYYTPMGIQKGRLRVTPEGEACFSYDDDGYKTESCYPVERNGKGFMFNSNVNGVFVTTRVITGVKVCRADELVS